jgi:four helix bundle protein
MKPTQKVRQFEDLDIYKQARDLTNAIYRITRSTAFSKDYGLVDQIRRAAVSIMSNIAEGFERGTNAEFIQFLYIAKGSCGEVRAQLAIALDQKYIGHDAYKDLTDLARLVSGMIGNLIQYLKGSTFKGSKFKTPPVKSMQEWLNEKLQEIKNAQQPQQNP